VSEALLSRNIILEPLNYSLKVHVLRSLVLTILRSLICIAQSRLPRSWWRTALLMRRIKVLFVLSLNQRIMHPHVSKSNLRVSFDFNLFPVTFLFIEDCYLFLYDLVLASKLWMRPESRNLSWILEHMQFLSVFIFRRQNRRDHRLILFT